MQQNPPATFYKHFHDGRDEVSKSIERFEKVPFLGWIVQAMRHKGFMQPTAVHAMSWPVALKGHDLVSMAEMGSGKTMAYIPLMLVHILAQPALRPGE